MKFKEYVHNNDLIPKKFEYYSIFPKKGTGSDGKSITSSKSG